MSAVTSTPLPTQSIIGSTHDMRLEPSPAGTYGSSIASDIDDEIPQTPNDEGVLLNKLTKLNIHVKPELIEEFSPTFVRNGVNSDDPFSDTVHQPQDSAQLTPTGKSTKRALNKVNWHSRAGSENHTSPSTSPLEVQKSRTIDRGHRIKDSVSESSDVGKFDTMQVNPQDAQAIYPPSSCVFVANLLQSESDEALEVAVLEVFREFGTVFVKIRRDAKHMPFAFCQYTLFNVADQNKNDESAELAINNGRGKLIKGRPCRCEKAKAHRLFFFEHKYGTKITPDEVEHLLRDFGRLTECRFATHLEMASNNLSEGVVVNFDMFESGKNACQAFRNHAVYRMISLFHLGSPRGDRSQSDPARRAYLETYEVDRRSVFVGNLPTEISELEVKEIFLKFGDIINIAVHKNESTVDPSSKHCFAFVEFAYQPSVEKAIPELNGSLLRGKTIRVTQKDSETARARSRRQITRPYGSSTVSAYQTPPVASHALCNPSPCMTPPVSQTQFGGYGYTSGGYANPFYLDTRGQCWITPTSPYNHSYPSGPSFQASPFHNSHYQSNPFYGYSGSPQGPQNYNWHQTLSPVWGAPNLPATVSSLNSQAYSSSFAAPVTSNEQCPILSPNIHTIADSSKEFIE
ncbi:putative rna recognition domain-containing protein [Golovinomyces cichoracearum]|uniref:Putative rna recognition domain-containing protein n=1 Tax=Golovinomyces cichoracearum TaxID=62708 RepID=A0A420ICL9_9PEZI|nr:putative rna recognition domain-containing protein [Golovinomyces cichoracearum]